MRAPVNKIIPFSSVDGPGNRTAIFLQGCNYDCKYCHNPETRKLCIHCGICVPGCPSGALSLQDGRVLYDYGKCIDCDQCIQVCPHDASPKIRELTPEELLAEVKKQIPFIRGVTVSGGECTLYPEFLEAFFILCHKEGLTTLVDSNGTLDFSQYPELLSVTDGVMLDVKAWGEKDHEEVTGAPNEMVKNNLTYLAREGKLEEVRTVVVPGLFDYKGTVIQTAKTLEPFLSIKNIRYKLIAYRPMGVRAEYADMVTPDNQELQILSDLVKAEGFSKITII